MGADPRAATTTRVDRSLPSPQGDDVCRLDITWAHGPVGDALREAAGRFVLSPLMSFYCRRRVEGREHLSGLTEPVVFVANHASHMDTPAILRALPRRWRRRTVVAAAADHFYVNRWIALLVSVLFNTVPIARRGSTAPMAQLDRLLTAGYSVLLYPEGTRSRTGDLGRLREGAAALAARHGGRMVPIHVHGTHAAMPPGRRWPRRIGGRVLGRRHTVGITIGRPITARVGERRAATEEVARFLHEASRAAR